MTLTAIRPQEVSITIKRKDYGLKYDLNAFAHIGQIMGSIPKAFELLNNSDLSAIRVFLWAGMLHQGENVSIKEIEKLSKQQSALNVIAAALEIALSEDYDFSEEWDWSLLYYIGTATLNMSEEAFWSSTPRKLISLIKVVGEIKGVDLKTNQNLVDKDALKAFMNW